MRGWTGLGSGGATTAKRERGHEIGGLLSKAQLQLEQNVAFLIP